MVEYHGWFTVRDSTVEMDDVRIEEIAKDLRKRVDAIRAENRIVGFQVVNGNYMIWLAGCTNHWSSDIEGVFELLRYLGLRAPGSYGLLYIWDDASKYENEFRVWRMAKGSLSDNADPFLSPCIPVIEDAG